MSVKPTVGFGSRFVNDFDKAGGLSFGIFDFLGLLGGFANPGDELLGLGRNSLSCLGGLSCEFRIFAGLFSVELSIFGLSFKFRWILTSV
jgi:hypothetical protein